ncbi:hypothetical protein B0A55_12999 [Friedmanniomyces simplex]|uniref:Uncharacterized protein n=1 Tax=Friedmanniomyces simplex TaxID=329884 RepID=A0A4U0VA05_9PEZI|nr:hypothetical protein B0A55_12999 [Friedmanniomyces simplex]
MPNVSDIYRMLSGQAFGATYVPTVDLSGKTIVVTGANTGLGLDAAKHFECGRNSADWMVFVCNAVVELKNFELAEGLERTLTINVVSTYLLAIAVLPKLQETADTHSVDTRLTLVGSIIHVFAPDKQL